MLRAAQVKFYKENGFIIVRNVLRPQDFKSLFLTIKNLLINYSDGLVHSSEKLNSWDDENFHRIMLELRDKNPQRFSAIYEAAQKSCAISSLAINRKILVHAATLLNDYPENLSYPYTILRMDVPNDSKNKTGFHQDAAYFDYPAYLKNLNVENNLSCWIPMTNINSDGGAIKVCAKSHKHGFLHNHDQMPTTNPISSKIAFQYEIPEINMNVGDIIFFYGSLVHSSGENISNKIRFTFFTRYFRMITDDFYLHPDVRQSKFLLKKE